MPEQTPQSYITETADTWQSLLILLSPYTKTLRKTVDDVALVQLANEHHVLFALIEQLHKKQAMALFEPLTQEYFAELYGQQCLRQQKALQQIASITQCLNQEGLVPLYFKGAAFSLACKHAHDASRFFIDVDILLPEGDAQKAQTVLQQSGYQPTDIQPSRHHHLPSLQHPEFPLSVEVHTEPLPARAGFALPAAVMLQNSELLTDNRFGSYRLPAANDSFALLAANAELANLGALTGVIDLKDALDALALFHELKVKKLPSDYQTYLYAILRIFNAPDEMLEHLPKNLGEERLAHFYQWQQKGFNDKRLFLEKLKQRFSKPCLLRKYGKNKQGLRPAMYAKELVTLLRKLANSNR